MEGVNARNVVLNKGPQQMSSSLKDRLKRCGRYYSSPTTPKPNIGFLPTPDSSAASSRSLNLDCPTPTCDNGPVSETPPSAILTPSSSDNHKGSTFADSSSLSCSTPVLKVRDSQGSHPRVKRLRLSSQACFKVQFPSESNSEEGGENHPKQQVLNSSLLEDSISEISTCDDKTAADVNSPEKVQPTITPGMCSQSSGDHVRNHESQEEHCTDIVPESMSCEELLAKKLQLQKRLKENRECLRKLKMVKLYRSKNDLSSLDDLILKWRGVSQQVLLDLYQNLPQPKPNLSGFLQHLNLDMEFLKFNLEEESFN